MRQVKPRLGVLQEEIDQVGRIGVTDQRAAARWRRVLGVEEF